MFRVWTCALALLCFCGAAFAAPEGPVVLTVAGAIEHTNRDAFDPFEDKLAAAHDFSFERARAFDMAMLEELGMKTLSVQYPDWPRAYTFEGPLLYDVLRAAGVKGKTVQVVALDGYAAEISVEELRDHPVLLAVKKDGRYLGLGGRGPTWVVFPRDDFKVFAARDETQWVWSAYLILVE